jgi:Protein of unknown function (DUF559)
MRRPLQIRQDIDVESGSLPVDRRIARLAERQHARVARWQLEAMGLGRGAIQHRVKVGRLTVVHRGVYAVGCRRDTREARWMAAVLAGGRDALLSHRSAAALWRIREPAGDPSEIIVPSGRQGPRGVRVHRGQVPDDERTTHDGIPVTTVPRTLLDLAATLARPQLERALERAEALRHAGALSVPDLLDRYPRHRGAAKLRAIVAEGVRPAATRSELEDRFLELISSTGLPRPEVNALLTIDGASLEVDCLWRSDRLVVELDGHETHGTRAAFERDRLRDRRLLRAGFRVARVTWRQLAADPDAVAGDVEAVLTSARRAIP